MMYEPLDAMVNRVPPAEPPFEPAHGGLLAAPPASSAERLWSALDRNPVWTLTSLVVLYLAIACGQGATKLLWSDELITLAIARQGSLAAIWRALAAGADPNPPLTHWLTLQSICAFGEGALVVRLPAILCVLLAIVSLWAILRRWVSPGYAAAGVLTFMATRGFDYAYDARSYAPLMGFSMASLAFWLASCDDADSDAAVSRAWPRLGALAAMVAAIALGLSSNYYGVLALFPIALGEAFRAVRRFPGVNPAAGRVRFAAGVRSFQPGVWLALPVAALPLLAFLPLIRHNIAEFAPHAWNRPRAGMIVASYLELVEGIFWPVFALALYAAWKLWRDFAIPATTSCAPSFQHSLPKAGVPPEHPRDAAHQSPLQPHEAAALAVLILYPILGFSVALGGGGMISPRCVVPVCCGFGIAAALLARRVFAASPRAGVLLLTGLLVWVVARESACAFVLARQRTAFLTLRDQVALQPSTQPIVVADSLFVLPLAHYSSDEVRARIIFPIDFDDIHAREPDDSGEQNLWAGRNGLFPIRVVAYDRSLFAGRDLILIARPTGWLSQRLVSDGFRLSQPAPNLDWQRLGGVFTPLAHEDTRLQMITDH